MRIAQHLLILLLTAAQLLAAPLWAVERCGRGLTDGAHCCCSADTATPQVASEASLGGASSGCCGDSSVGSDERPSEDDPGCRCHVTPTLPWVPSTIAWESNAGTATKALAALSPWLGSSRSLAADVARLRDGPGPPGRTRRPARTPQPVFTRAYRV